MAGPIQAEHSRGGCRKHRGGARAAFTLLEVLITAILLATLLVGVWSLYQAFAALYDTGFVQTEKALMVRSLTQQLANDLLNAVPPPADSNATAAQPPIADQMAGSSGAETPSCAGRVGLLGTYNTLRLDILLTDPPVAPETPLQNEFAAVEDDVSRQTAEVVTVLYTFVPPAMTETDLLAGKPGFTRRELRINRSSEDDMRLAAALGESIGLQYQSAGSFAGVQTADTAADRQTETVDDSLLPQTVTTHLPEVVALEFRYFDGQDWTDAWDSRAQKSLPSAVEVAFELESHETSKPHSAATAGVPTAATVMPAAEQPMATPSPEAQDGGSSARRRTPSYRFVVYLPQSAIPRASPRFQPEAASEEPLADPALDEPEPGDVMPVPDGRRRTR
jgi:hypothetical protein